VHYAENAKVPLSSSNILANLKPNSKIFLGSLSEAQMGSFDQAGLKQKPHASVHLRLTRQHSISGVFPLTTIQLIKLVVVTVIM
jgi:hypothetical protein